MKKSLSLLVALSMAFGTFASVAAADSTPLTTEQKYQQFLDAKILKGNPDGQAHLADNLTRAEFATIITAVAGLQQSASTSSFKDVLTNQWWFGAIQAAADAGLVNGVGANLFSPKDKVTVEQVIKVAVLLAKLTPVAGATVEGSDAWAGPYIQAAINAGLPIPTNYKDAATRGQTIDVAYAVTQALAVPTLSDVAAVANGDDTITVTGKVSDKADSVKVALGTNEAVAATLNADKTFTYTTAKQANGTYTLTVVAYEGTKASAKVEKSVSINAFAVESATVLNAKQIAVKFTKSVQKGINEGGANYYTDAETKAPVYFNINGIYPARVDVSDDGKTATLSFNYTGDFATLVNNSSTALLGVSGDLNSASGQDLPAYSNSILLKDATAPSVTDVSFKGVLAKVTFSEPLGAEGSEGVVSINGDAIYPYTDPAPVESSDGIVYTYTKDAEGDITGLTIYNLSKDTSYDLDIVGFTDLKGNDADFSKTIKVPNDTEAPTVTNVTVVGAIVSVKFSEDIRGSKSHATFSVNDEVLGDQDADADDHKKELSYDADSATVKLDLNGFLNGSAFRNVTLKVTGQEDYAQNTQGSTYSKSIKITNDTTAPTFSSVTVDGNKIIAKFSEDLKTSDTDGIHVDLGDLGYKYTDSNGVPHKGTIHNTGYSAVVGYDLNNDGDTDDANEKQYVVITVSDLDVVNTSNKFPAGKYAVTLVHPDLTKTPADPYELSDLNGNPIDADVTLNFTTTSSTTSGLLHLVGAYQLSNVAFDSTTTVLEKVNSLINAQTTLGTDYFDKDNNKFVFVFDHELTLAQLKNENFLINNVAAPAGSDISFDGSRKVVVVTVPAGSIKTNGQRTLKAVNLVDVDGNTLNTDDNSAKSSIIENVKPTVKSAEFVSGKEIKVTFSEKISATSASNSGISVYINGTKYTGTLTVTADGSTTVSIAAAAEGDFNTDKKVEVKFSSASLYDLTIDNDGAGNQVTDTTVTVG